MRCLKSKDFVPLLFICMHIKSGSTRPCAAHREYPARNRNYSPESDSRQDRADVWLFNVNFAITLCDSADILAKQKFRTFGDPNERIHAGFISLPNGPYHQRGLKQGFSIRGFMYECCRSALLRRVLSCCGAAIGSFKPGMEVDSSSFWDKSLGFRVPDFGTL